MIPVKNSILNENKLTKESILKYNYQLHFKTKYKTKHLLSAPLKW